MNAYVKVLCWIAVGAALGVLGKSLLQQQHSQEAEGAAESARKPQYWVAPMDPNYRRSEPGKSPMGMELIPVYAEDANDDGTVRILPDVVNNLGVRTALVGEGQFNTRVSTVGYVQYDEDHLVHIHPRVEGWIEKLYVKAEGDPVAAGAALYDIYSPMLVNAQEELLLAMNRDNPGLLHAAEQRLAALQVPDAAIASLKKSRKVSQTITVSAPQSGVVDDLGVREGMFVRPGMSAMSIAVVDEVWVVGEVFERQATLVGRGDRVLMYLDYLPGREWVGSIDYVYPTLDEKTRTARIRARFDNADGVLMPGMFARLRIELADGEPAVLIPREALIRTGEQNRVVLAMGDGMFRSVLVRPGRIGEQQVEILDGLKAGDRIVTSAQFLIDSESSKTADFNRMDHGDAP